MKLEFVTCLITMRASGAGEQTVVKAGPSAISVAEIPIIESMFAVDEDGAPPAVSNIAVSNNVETTKKAELARLKLIYPAAVIKDHYSGSNTTHMPMSLSDLDLDPKQMQPKSVKANADLKEKTVTVDEAEEALKEAQAAAKAAAKVAKDAKAAKAAADKEKADAAKAAKAAKD